MKALVHVHSADEYCHHLCPNQSCGHVFPDVARSEWPSAADHCCPECGASRFKYVAGRLVPQKRCASFCRTSYPVSVATVSIPALYCTTNACDCRYWDFGIVEVVKDMFKSSKFREQYQHARPYDDPTSYFASAAFKAYVAAANGRVGRDRPADVCPTCMLQLGGDGVSLLNFGQRTATVIGVRCEELRGEFSQSNLSWRPIIIIEGPQETKVLHRILEATVNKLRMHAPLRGFGVLQRPSA